MYSGIRQYFKLLFKVILTLGIIWLIPIVGLIILIPSEKPINLALTSPSNLQDVNKLINEFSLVNHSTIDCDGKEVSGNIYYYGDFAIANRDITMLCTKYGIAEYSLFTDHYSFSMIGPSRGYIFLEYYPYGVPTSRIGGNNLKKLDDNWLEIRPVSS